MRRFCPEGIIFTCILLVGLVTGCGEQDKPKAASPSKEVATDPSKNKPQEITTKERQAVLNDNIEPEVGQQSKQLPKIVLLTTTQACHCKLERCAKAEEIVNELVQRFPKKLIFEKLDHAREQGLVEQLVREHKIHSLPALLFFDKKGTFNGKLVGFLDKEEIEKKFKKIGLE